METNLHLRKQKCRRFCLYGTLKLITVQTICFIINFQFSKFLSATFDVGHAVKNNEKCGLPRRKEKRFIRQVFSIKAKHQQNMLLHIPFFSSCSY